MEWYLNALEKYATFKGRARRKEFWMFFLVNFIISVLVGVAQKVFKVPHFSDVYNLATLIPTFAVSSRRLHDIGKSGWYQMIPFYNIYLFTLDGDRGSNSYGSDPKDEIISNKNQMSA